MPAYGPHSAWKGEAVTSFHAQVAGVVGLSVFSAALLLAAVQRAAMIRALEVQVQAERAARDSIDASNAAARVELVRLARTDRVLAALTASGFTVPAGDDLRFVVYPGRSPMGTGALPPRLASYLRDERRQVHGHEAWLWGWVRRLPASRTSAGGRR